MALRHYPLGSSSSSLTEQERWDERYIKRPLLFGREPCRFLSEKIGMLPKGRTLDVAAGEGRNAIFLASHGFDVTAMDISPVAMARAELLAKERGVRIETVVADFEDYDAGRERFDLIVNFFAYQPSIIPRLVAALKPGGMLVFETFSIEHLKLGASFGPRDAAFLVKPNELLRRLDALRILFYEDFVTEMNQGRHDGAAALIHFIAQKPLASNPSP